jgi:hypothetical protein
MSLDILTYDHFGARFRTHFSGRDNLDAPPVAVAHGRGPDAPFHKIVLAFAIGTTSSAWAGGKMLKYRYGLFGRDDDASERI